MIYKFRKKPEPTPTPHAGALTTNEFFERYPDHRPEVPDPQGVAVLVEDANPLGRAWVFFQADKNGHRWWGYRAWVMARAGRLGDGVTGATRPVLPVVREGFETDFVAANQYLGDKP